jgi:hypothetical protein
MELAQSKADHRILVWNLLFPRLKSPSEKLCVVGSVMLAHRLVADRMDAGEYSVLYELLGHPHEIIRRPIIEELSRLIHADDAGAQRNQISVNLLSALLHLTAGPDGLSDVVSFAGDVFLPGMALTLWYVCKPSGVHTLTRIPHYSRLGKTNTIVAALEHPHPQLRRGCCLALETIAQSPEKHRLLSAGALEPCCNTKRLRGDDDLTRLICTLVPNIIEFVKKREELELLFRLFG